MADLTRTYTADALAVLGLPWENYLARDDEDEHRWYVNWRIIFRDPADNTTWSIIRAEDKGEMDGVDWWNAYDSRDAIVAKRMDVRQVMVDEWFEVTADACRRCRTPFDPLDIAVDGHARHADSPWCRDCVSSCHEGSADHRCVICHDYKAGS